MFGQQSCATMESICALMLLQILQLTSSVFWNLPLNPQGLQQIPHIPNETECTWESPSELALDLPVQSKIN